MQWLANWLGNNGSLVNYLLSKGDRMYQVNITMPVAQNNGGVSNLFMIEEIENSIARCYGGFSSTSINGGWFDTANDRYYSDRSTVVSVLVDGIVQVNEIKRRAEQWAIALQQIELLVTVQEVEVNFIKGTRAQAIA
jgi:hypothetical protein